MLEDSLLGHQSTPVDTSKAQISPSKALNTSNTRVVSLSLLQTGLIEVPKTWNQVRYFPDKGDLIPQLRTQKASEKSRDPDEQPVSIHISKPVFHSAPKVTFLPSLEKEISPEQGGQMPGLLLLSGSTVALLLAIVVSGAFVGSGWSYAPAETSFALSFASGDVFWSGIDTLRSFFFVLIGSFSDFLNSGFQFLLSLFQLG